MAAKAPPTIFSRTRRTALRRRMAKLQSMADAPRYFPGDIVEDILERLAFLRHEPKTALVIGDVTGALAAALELQGSEVSSLEPAACFDEEQPYPASGFDFIASLATLDTINDLPGALLHIRNALAPGGLMIASFAGAGSLPMLRQAMLEADGERPAPRIHPQVDVRAGGQLLQRAGFADPVIDSRSLQASFATLDRLVADLRAQGLTNVLADPGPPIGKAGVARAKVAFDTLADEHGRVTETFEVLTLSGWRK